MLKCCGGCPPPVTTARCERFVFWRGGGGRVCQNTHSGPIWVAGERARKRILDPFGGCRGRFWAQNAFLALRWRASVPEKRILDPLGAVLGRSWGPFGAIWGRLGPSWGRLGAVLGPSWARPGSSWACLGGSWGVLGPSWRLLGEVLGRFSAIFKNIQKPKENQ